MERALMLLDALSGDEGTMSLADLSRKTGFYKSTILRLSGSLERFGYLTRQADGRFRLGPALWRMGSLYGRDFDLGEHVRPMLRRLRDTVGETASFYIRDGDVRVCLYSLNSKRAIRHHLEEGMLMPLERGAAGRLLLAYSDDDRADSRKIRAAGYAISLGERDPDIAAVAVPVRRANGQIQGALSLSGLITHFDSDLQKRAIKELSIAATELGQRLID
ncbi:MAG: IclR family transcriptional regulator [Alphaproteobacteria bacterium]|nr:IclR family transcriptional regulator [Alphaproteobacteria bacterium]